MDSETPGQTSIDIPAPAPAAPHGSLAPNAPGNAKKSPEQLRAESSERRVGILRTKIAKCKRIKRQLVPLWSRNVDYRRGKQFEEESDLDRIQIGADWARTKAKQAQLFSQVPSVRMTPRMPEFGPGALMYAKKLNQVLEHSRVSVAMDECLPAVINAAGVSAVHISYESRSVEVDDPEAAQSAPELGIVEGSEGQESSASFGAASPNAEPSGVDDAASISAGLSGQGADEDAAPDGDTQEQPPVKPTVPYTTAHRINIASVSPADLIWDVSWVGSDFNRCPIVGREGRLHWFDAKEEFHLTDQDYAQVVTGDTRTPYELIKHQVDNERDTEDDLVEYVELYYYRHLYHADEASFDTIQRIVFVKGKKQPVIDEPWTGQKVVMDGNDPVILGSSIRPLQFLTLTYITDDNIPPSDTAMGRPQVDELIRSRTQIIRNRETSVPMRWANVNLLDPSIMPMVLRGTWQGIIPTNGAGDKVIGEVARAAYPREDFEFANIANRDLDETWQLGPADQNGSGTQIRSSAEAQIRQQNFSTRIGYERARVTDFFLRIAQVTAGLMQLYYPWTSQEEQALGPLLQNPLPTSYAFEVRADATVLIDSQQRVQRLINFANLFGKSGYVPMEDIIQEIAALSGIEVQVQKPEGKGPEPISVSLKVDENSLKDPVVVAMLMQSGQLPPPAMIEQAKQFILQSMQPVAPPQPGGQPGQPGPGLMASATPGAPPPGGPGAQPAAGGVPHPPLAGGAQNPSPAPMHQPAPAAQPAGHAMEDRAPGWTELPRVNKRTHDGA